MGSGILWIDHPKEKPCFVWSWTSSDFQGKTQYLHYFSQEHPLHPWITTSSPSGTACSGYVNSACGNISRRFVSSWHKALWSQNGAFRAQRRATKLICWWNHCNPEVLQYTRQIAKGSYREHIWNHMIHIWFDMYLKVNQNPQILLLTFQQNLKFMEIHKMPPPPGPTMIP